MLYQDVNIEEIRVLKSSIVERKTDWKKRNAETNYRCFIVWGKSNLEGVLSGHNTIHSIN